MAKKVIGRSDIVSFPALGLDVISVKVDTGAFTSSIHCKEIEVIEEDGEEKLQFLLLDPEHEQFHEKLFTVSHFTKKNIKNSFGEIEERYVIETKIEIFQTLYPIELSLSNRQNMRFPVLLGRKVLDHFLVDVSKKNLSFKESLLIKQ